MRNNLIFLLLFLFIAKATTDLSIVLIIQHEETTNVALALESIGKLSTEAAGQKSLDIVIVGVGIDYHRDDVVFDAMREYSLSDAKYFGSFEGTLVDAYNLAVAESLGKFILFCNEDVLVPGVDALGNLVGIVDNGNDVGAVSALMRFNDGTVYHAGIVLMQQAPVNGGYGYWNEPGVGDMPQIYFEYQGVRMNDRRVIKRREVDAVPESMTFCMAYFRFFYY